MRILVVSSHPDDLELGVGGTIAKLSEWNDIISMVLSTGVTSRIQYDKNLVEEVLSIPSKTAKILGIREVYQDKLFRDQRMDGAEILDIIHAIEEVIDSLKPDIIYTHYHLDLNEDHKIVSQAVMTACRPMRHVGKSVKKIYEFEVLSSTEWTQYEVFKPNVYVDITDTIEKKKDALSLYKSEIGEFPFPRSLEGVEVLAKKRGMEAGLKYAEAFILVRSIE